MVLIYTTQIICLKIGIDMLLPATGIEIPSEDWKIVKFHEYKEESTDGRMSFEADILHIPSGLILVVDNNGRSDENDYGVVVPDRTTSVDPQTAREILNSWDALAHECLPLLRVQAQASDVPFFRTAWDGENHRQESLRDGTFEFFLSEELIQDSYSRKRNVLVRHDDDGKVYTYKTNKPAVLAGRVAGSYWDKKVKNWVKL